MDSNHLHDIVGEKNNEHNGDLQPIVIPSDGTSQGTSNPFQEARLNDNGQNDINNDTITKPKLISLIVELFVVFLDQIFYYKGVYPRSSFRRMKSFGIIVYQNRHPGVIEYLSQLQYKLYDLLDNGNLNRFIVELHSGDTVLKDQNSLLEVYGLSIANSPILRQFSVDGRELSFQRKDFPLRLVVAEFQSLLTSIVTALVKTGVSNTSATTGTTTTTAAGEVKSNDSSLSSLQDQTNSRPPVFKVLISPAYDPESNLFLDLISDEDWILERTSKSSAKKGTAGPKISLGKLNNFKDVDLNFLQIKGFCMDVREGKDTGNTT